MKYNCYICGRLAMLKMKIVSEHFPDYDKEVIGLCSDHTDEFIKFIREGRQEKSNKKRKER